MAGSFNFFSSLIPSTSTWHLETKHINLAQQFLATQNEILWENKVNNPANEAENTVIEKIMRICM